MDKTELDAIREKVALEPPDSIAHQLLAEVDRLHESADQQAEVHLRRSFRVDHGLNDEEVGKVMAAFARGDYFPEMEQGPCRVCRGTGHKSVSGCFGPRLGERCPGCRGRGITSRIKVP